MKAVGVPAPDSSESERRFPAASGTAWRNTEASFSQPSPLALQKSSLTEDLSSSDDEESSERADVGSLEATLGDYDFSEEGINKIRNHLKSAQSGATRCIICLEKVRATDPVWDCQEGCYAVMHLICIQSWARQLIAAAGLRGASSDPLPSNAPTVVTKPKTKANWHCPKCRREYASSRIPSQYRCYCGKETDPTFNPWLVPHTCGETCGRCLSLECGHTCMLLCHPGPCPPCPQLVKARCFCGASEDVRRCGRKEFACGGLCNHALACGMHRCQQPCHSGGCPPCPEASVFSCRCGRLQEKRTCAQRDFSCGKKCGRQLSCGRHVCERLCHQGKCGDCPLSGPRVCPCGKTEVGELPCDVPTPTCGATCEKLLGCGRHTCPERCHVGPCAETCRVVTDKACRCGGLQKQVPCFQELTCERRCQRQRACGRHACKRRCCDGECPPCSEVCERKLRCGNHKCPAPCHVGPCAPCPVTVRIACACGATAITVPCGTDGHVKPPRCNRACQIPRRCRHALEAPAHRCHYGNCPPCKMICGEPLDCGHTCPEGCHGPSPAPGPIYTLRPTKKHKKALEQEASSEGSPCPPCLHPVTVHCLGGHSHKQAACSSAEPFQCDQSCGNALTCGNHTCEKRCHSMLTSEPKRASDELDCDAEAKPQREHNDNLENDLNGTAKTRELPPSEACETCTRKCSKPRAPPCTHPCPLRCHPGTCPPCKSIVRRKCHCEAEVSLALECQELADAEKQGAESINKLLSCGQKCDKKLLYCGHTCQEICHGGPCPNPEQCRKKVTVRCPCRRQKKDWPCADVRAAQTSSSSKTLELLNCDKECEKLAEQKRAREVAKKVKEEPQQKELPKKPEEGPSKGRRRGRKRDLDEEASGGLFSEATLQWVMRVLWWALCILIALAVVYVCVKVVARIDQHMKTTPPPRPRRPRYYRPVPEL